MTLYTFAELEGLWERAGGKRALAPVMAAIALAESHPPGDPTHADSGATGGVGERGLWQINPHAWGSLATYDPAGNARAAVHVQRVQGLSAWTTFNDGAYKHFLHSAAPVAPIGTGQAPGTGGHGPGHPLPAPGGNATGGQVSASAAKAVEAITDIGQTSSTESWWTELREAIGTLDPLSGIPAAIVALSLPFAKFAQAIDWFFVPSHWVRIFAGIGGGIAVIGGVWQLAHSGQDRPAALPMGIALTGLGGVLLFVAFHNLDPSIKTPGEFLADLQGKAQTGLAATTSPAQAVTAAGG